MKNAMNRRIRDIMALAGQWPSISALSVGAILSLPSVARAQDEVPPAPAAPTTPAHTPNADTQVSVSEHQTVDLTVKDEDIRNVLDLLGAQSRKNIVVSKNVSARVTQTLYGVTFNEAMDAVLHVNGFGYIEKGNFIYVYTQEELVEIKKSLQQRVAKVIRLNYLSAKDAAELVDPLKSPEGMVKTSMDTKDFSIPDDGPVGGEDYANGAMLVVFDYEENLAAIEALLKEVDTRPAQVLVEATILQTALSEDNAFGVDFSLIGDLNFTDFTNGPLSAANSLIRGAGSSSGSGSGSGTSSGGGFAPADDVGRAVTSTAGRTEGPATLKIGVLADDIAIFLKVLDDVTDTTILSNPKVLALNRQPARVLVGRKVGYLSTTSTETSTTQTVEFLDTGTQLFFRPFVSNDGEIRMELKPQVSEAIIREATDATGAAVSIPDEVTQELVTNVIVRDGQTIVLGGLFRESTKYSRRQVPGLGDLPLVGAAFRGHEDDIDRSEVIFLITPTIVSSPMIDMAASHAEDEIERIRAGTRQGLLPFSRDRMTQALNVEAERLAQEGNYDKAMWNLQRSLSLSPLQPDAMHLRERITGRREIWPDRTMMSRAMDPEVAARLNAVKPNPAVPDTTPRGHFAPPMKNVDESGPQSINTGSDAPAAGSQAHPLHSAQHSHAQFAELTPITDVEAPGSPFAASSPQISRRGSFRGSQTTASTATLLQPAPVSPAPAANLANAETDASDK